MSNLPKLSNRAKQALDILADGGRLVSRLERNSYTGREQFQTRFTLAGKVVRGLGLATRRELEKAGFNFSIYHSTTVSTTYKLETSR